MSREEGHIGPLQGVILVYAVLTAMLFLQYPVYLISAGGPAAWQVALVVTGAALALFLPTAALARRFPGQGLAEISEQVAGPMLGSLFTLSVAAWLFFAAAVTVRNFTETFIVAILPTTPPSVLTVVTVLCALYASYRGLEPLARAAQVLFPLIAAGVFLVILFSLPRAEVSRLYPLWGNGLQTTLNAGIAYAGMGAEAILLLVLGYGFREGKGVSRSGFLAILLFGLSAAVTVAVLVMIFGAPDAADQPFPMFNLARLVYLGGFLQRTEALLVMFWFFAAAVRVSALFHGTVVSLAGTLGLPYYRPLVFPLAVVLMAVSMLPPDFISIVRLDRDWIRPLAVYVLLVPVLLLTLALVRRKRGQAHVA